MNEEDTMQSLLTRPTLKGWIQITRSGWFPAVLLVTWVLGRAGGRAWWEGAAGMPRQGWLMLSACVVLLAWWQVVFNDEPPPDKLPRPLWSFGLGAWAALAWGCMWLALPAWGLLKLANLLAFAPALAWQWHRAGRQAKAAGVWLGYVLSGLLATFVVLVHPWQAGRFLQAVWPARLDVQGPHYEASQLMNTLAALKAWGPAVVQVPSVLVSGDSGAWLLHVGVAWGWVPMGVCTVAAMLCWVALAWWLQRSPMGTQLTLRTRRLGVALAWFHALATGLYAAWSLGWLYRPMGALPPFSHAGWWVLTLALVWCVRGSWLQRRERVTAEPIETEHPAWWWGALLAVLIAGAAGVQGMPGRVQAWAAAREAANDGPPHLSPPRPTLLDRTGQHVLATQSEALDLWVRPSEFWSASWQNPKTPPEIDARLNNAQRRAALLNALAPWPQAARLAALRLDAWSYQDETPKLLLWAQPPEVVQAVRSAMNQQELNGLTFTTRPLRVYPQGPLTAHAVGFASLATPMWGQAGLEQALDHVEGLWQDFLPRQHPPKKLHTSLDMDIQRMAHDALGEAMRLHRSPRGAMVVADASTVEVLAMVSAPSFNPNDSLTFRNPHRPDRIRNLATDVPLTAGPPLLAPLSQANAMQQGTLSMAALKSSTPIAAKAMTQALMDQHRQHEDRSAFLRDTGLTRLSAMVGIQNTGLIDSGWFTWVDDPDESLYQGGNTTLTGLVRAYLPIANDGVDLTLTLLSTRHAWPRGMSRDDPKQVLTGATACAVRRWMRGNQYTHGNKNWLELDAMGSVEVSTMPQKPDQPAKRQRVQRTHATYVGMVPAAQPRYVVGVVLGFDQAAAPRHGRAAEDLFATLARGLLTNSAGPHVSNWACTEAALPAQPPANAKTVN